MFSPSTIQKLFDQAFGEQSSSDEPPAQRSAADRKKLITQMESRFNAIDRVTCGTCWIRQSPRDEALGKCAREITISAGSARRQESFIITVDFRTKVERWMSRRRRCVGTDAIDEPPRAGIWIVDSTPRGLDESKCTLVSDLKQIETLIELIKARHERSRFRQSRNLKVTSLRKRSFNAQLKELGQKHNFAFRIGNNARDVNLSLRLNVDAKAEPTEYHLSFPQSRFGDVLEKLPGIIDKLKGLAARNVEFHTDNSSWPKFNIQSHWKQTKARKALEATQS